MALTIGGLTIEPIYDGTLVVAPTQLVPGSSETDWAQHADLLREDGQLELACGGFLVRGHEDRIVLVDTGFGADDPRCGQISASLRVAGVEPEDVTDVVLTHLHRDHVGGVMQGGEVTFPNATYRCHSADWAYFAGDKVPDSVAPGHDKLAVLLGRLEPWDSDCTLLPGLSVVEAPGHTPGSSLVVLSDDDQRLMLLGDVIPCAVNLLESEWAALADVDQKLAARTRENVIREIEEGNVLAAGGHFPGLQFGRILEGQGRKHVVFETPE